MWNFLAYRNRFTIGPLTQEMTQGEGLYDPLLFPADDGILRLTFEMRLSEFTRVYTALNKGAILSYPDQSEDVIWYFLRNFEFPIMPDCGDVQDCIENDPETRETIQEIIQNGTTPSGGGVFVTDDDLDRLFGMIRFLVDTMHDAIVDVFQIADDTSDLRERATLLFSAIPGAQLLPFDEGANYIDSLLEDVGQQFDGQYTTTPISGSRDRISCGLFCLARDNENTLTWDLIRDYFWDAVAYESPGLNQFVDFAIFLATGTWAGQDIVNISFANMASALDQSARYGNLLFPSLNAIMGLGANNPDPDWETLCEDCATTEFCRMYEGSDLNALGTPTGGLGPQAVWDGTKFIANDALIPARITIECDIGTTVVLTSIECIFTAENADGDVDTITAYTEDFVSVIGAQEFTQETLIGVAATLQIFEIDVVSSFSATTTPITVGLERIILRGTGTAPATGVEC